MGASTQLEAHGCKGQSCSLTNKLVCQHPPANLGQVATTCRLSTQLQILTSSSPAPFLAPFLQTKLHEAAEGRATSLAAELGAVRQERDELMTSLGAAAAEADNLRQELASKSALLEKANDAKVGAGDLVSCT